MSLKTGGSEKPSSKEFPQKQLILPAESPHSVFQFLSTSILSYRPPSPASLLRGHCLCSEDLCEFPGQPQQTTHTCCLQQYMLVVSQFWRPRSGIRSREQGWCLLEAESQAGCPPTSGVAGSPWWPSVGSWPHWASPLMAPSSLCLLFS